VFTKNQFFIELENATDQNEIA